MDTRTIQERPKEASSKNRNQHTNVELSLEKRTKQRSHRKSFCRQRSCRVRHEQEQNAANES